MSTQKGTPMTKEESIQLVQLVEANPVLFSKATNASNNQLKEALWSRISDQFNSMIASSSRTPEQLRLKWENLKNLLVKETGGGKPDFIPPDDALDKVAAILGPTCEGYIVPFGGDALVEAMVETAQKAVVVDVPF